MENVLELQEVTSEQVIIKVNANDPLTVAKNPWVSSDEAYYTITRGREHIFTVIKKDGKTWSFHWGYSGYTLIAESVEQKKSKVLQFIRNNGIDIETHSK